MNHLHGQGMFQKNPFLIVFLIYSMRHTLIRLEKHFLKNKLDKLRETLKSQTSNEINSTMKEISTIDNHLQNVTTKYNSDPIVVDFRSFLRSFKADLAFIGRG